MFTDFPELIARHIRTLKAVFEPLLALLTAYGGLEAKTVPRTIHSVILRVLRPAEAALRRIIVMAARNITVELRPAKARPQTATNSSPAPGPRPRSSNLNFRLTDPPPRRRRTKLFNSKPLPRAFFIDADPPFAPLFAPHPLAAETPEPKSSFLLAARPLCQRLKAMSQALGDVPQQARRLARMQALQFRKKKVFAPLRAGAPPGHRTTPRRDVDFVLRECHRAAQQVLSAPAADTS